MSYAVSILRRAQKELGQLSSPSFERVCDAIRPLAGNPRPPGCRKLVGRDGWRIRVGDYRVIYQIDDPARSVLVLHVGHRRDIYN
ncbi:MAG: type II toxin-antitoxin system RelE/ParE family toxin [candidate division WOR-3 bacterium]|nr:type II toxin-antitoxin system RelE/ParE family toxin [candidate division WOR-3 bacterium]